MRERERERERKRERERERKRERERENEKPVFPERERKKERVRAKRRTCPVCCLATIKFCTHCLSNSFHRSDPGPPITSPNSSVSLKGHRSIDAALPGASPKTNPKSM